MSAQDRGVAVLTSGGVESAVLLHHIADEGVPVIPVYVRQGFRWERTEVLWLEQFLHETRRPGFRPLEVLVLPLADLYPMGHFGTSGAVPAAGTPDEDCCLPGRNVTILAKAGVFAGTRGLSAIAIGSLGSNPFPDATRAFFEQMAVTISTGLGRTLRIRAPFLALRKPEVILLGRNLPLERTFSCMDPDGQRHCGVCAKCHERREAFRSAGLPDRTAYAGDPAPAESSWISGD